MIAEMQDQSVIRSSLSLWASPVVLVPKKDGKLRFCVDYRHLNAITKKDVYPLPCIDDILDALGKTGYFSSLDCGIGSNCPGISGTVPDLLTLSLVPEGLPICPGRSLISS